MSLLKIIREHELECQDPCRVSQWREARLRAIEVPDVQAAIAKGRNPKGWIVSLATDDNGRPMLRYTRTGEPCPA